MRTEYGKKKNPFLLLIPRTVHSTCIHLLNKDCNENGSVLECHCTSMMGCNFTPHRGHRRQSALCLQVFVLKMPVTHSVYCILASPRWYFKPLMPHKLSRISYFLLINWAGTQNAACFVLSESVTSHIECIFFIPNTS